MTNLEKFHYYLKDCNSPTHYIEWNYIFCISACLARRVWYEPIGGGAAKFFNQYLVFVAPPGVGKSTPANWTTVPLLGAMEVMERNPRGEVEMVKKVHQSATSCTLQQLYDDVAGAIETLKINETQHYSHSSMTFLLTEELGSLFQKDTNDIVTFMNDGWNCGNYKRAIKMNPKPIDIRNMCINFLGCCAPEWIMRNFSMGLLSEGFGARCIFIWAANRRSFNADVKWTPDQKTAYYEVLCHMKEVTKLVGKINPTEEAYEWLVDWTQNQNKTRINKHRKLDNYYARRDLHLVKVAAAYHFGRKLSMQIELEDFIYADKTLTTIELDMHKALTHGSPNPLAEIADSILAILDRAPASYKTIILKLFTGANQEQIDAALKWLAATDQIAATMVNTSPGYKRITSESSLTSYD